MKSWYPVFVFLCGITIAQSGGTASGCNVPVFRYALERWPADAYELVVFHEGPLTAEHQQLVDQLTERVVQEEYHVRTVDVATELEEADQNLYDSADAGALPWLLVRYPESYEEDPPAFAGPFGADVLDGLADSPARREIARRILKGDSVVWLLVESGDTDADAPVEKMLRERLDVLTDELKLPELQLEDQQYLQAEAGPELKLAFSVLNVSRADAKERMLIELLDGWVPEAVDKKQPAVFAFFGRGRVLGPLTGEDLVGEMIDEGCAFLTGPCSCQVKDQNPGFDMLMSVDWEGVIQGTYTLAEALPRLTSPVAVVQDNLAVAAALGSPVSPVDPVAAIAASPDVGTASAVAADPAERAMATTTLPGPDPSRSDTPAQNRSAAGTSFMNYVSAVAVAGCVLVLLGSLVILSRQRGKEKGTA